MERRPLLGTRFFLLAIVPGSLALAVWLTHPGPRLRTDIILLAVLLLSIWIAADSTVFDSIGAPRCYDPANLQEDYCRFGVVESDLWYPLTCWPHPHPARYAQLALYAFAACWVAGPVLLRILRTLRDRARPHVAVLHIRWRW